MAIRPIKSISKSSDNPLLKIFKSCREVDLCNLFCNLVVSAMEHQIIYQKGQSVAEFFSYVMSLVPAARNEDFLSNYSEVFEDFDDLFDKKQLKILNSMIFDSNFQSFIISIQEMFEIRDSKSSHNEIIQLIEFYSNSLKLNVQVISTKSQVSKFCVPDPFINLTIFQDSEALFILFPYEYKHFSLEQDAQLIQEDEEDMRKNKDLHIEIENQDPLHFNPASPSFQQTSPRFKLDSPSLARKSIGRLSSPSSSFQIEESDFQKRMAQRAKNFKEKRRLAVEKSPTLKASQNSGDFSIFSRNLSTEIFFQSKFRESMMEDSKIMNFRGDISLDSKERIKWIKETELFKEEVLRRQEIMKIEERIEGEELKRNEMRRVEIEKMIKDMKGLAQGKRAQEENRLERQRKENLEVKELWEKSRLDMQIKLQEESLDKKKEDEERLIEEKKCAEAKYLEAQRKLEEASKAFEELKAKEAIRLADEHVKRLEEERIEREIKLKHEELVAERRRLEEEELAELKRLEDMENSEKLRLEQEEQERLRIEEEEQLAVEEELRKIEEEKRFWQEQREAEVKRIEEEKRVEEEKANKEKLRIQRIQEEKKKRAQEEEEYLKTLQEKEAEKKRLAEEKQLETAKRAEEQKLEARRKEEEAKRKKEQEDRLKKEAEDKKRKEDQLKQSEEKKRSHASKVAEPEEQYEETDNTSFCGGLYCAKCARDLKRSNYLLKCDTCNDKYMKTGVASITPASSVPQSRTCMNCAAKITKGEEVSCMRCFIQTKIFGEAFSPCTGCVRTDKCYWIDASDAEERNMVFCGFCDEKKARDTVIVICSNCEDLICLICLRKNPYVTQGICSHCHNRRVPRLR